LLNIYVSVAKEFLVFIFTELRAHKAG